MIRRMIFFTMLAFLALGTGRAAADYLKQEFLDLEGGPVRRRLTV